jgi:hypothetical protein
MVTERGDAPLEVIVIVAVDGFGVGAAVGGGVGLGELGESLPPHDTAARATNRATLRDARFFHIRRTSAKC